MALVLISAAVTPGFINVPFPTMRIMEAETRLDTINATLAIIGVQIAEAKENMKSWAFVPAPPPPAPPPLVEWEAMHANYASPGPGCVTATTATGWSRQAYSAPLIGIGKEFKGITWRSRNGRNMIGIMYEAGPNKASSYDTIDFGYYNHGNHDDRLLCYGTGCSSKTHSVFVLNSNHYGGVDEEKNIWSVEVTKSEGWKVNGKEIRSQDSGGNGAFRVGINMHDPLGYSTGYKGDCMVEDMQYIKW